MVSLTENRYLPSGTSWPSAMACADGARTIPAATVAARTLATPAAMDKRRRMRRTPDKLATDRPDPIDCGPACPPRGPSAEHALQPVPGGQQGVDDLPVPTRGQPG